MKCPHCGHEKNRVLETRGDRRVRQCGDCLKDFSTMEVITVYAGRDRGWLNDSLPVEIDPALDTPLRKRPSKFDKFDHATLDDGLTDADPELARLLLAWWNESRRAKNPRAAWTFNAWNLNVSRVLGMPPRKAIALATRGVEQGWQSLLEEYVNDVLSTEPGTLLPMSEVMRRASEVYGT